jgi:hypothetical protein
MAHYIKRISLLLLFQISTIGASAEEGMWLPYNLNQKTTTQMQQKGLAIPLETIYNVSDPSLKDAVVSINNGTCTGSFISIDGLVLTNQHCIIEEVLRNSSLSQNFITDGFFANTYAEELPNRNQTIEVLVEARDVTDYIQSHFFSGTSQQRKSEIADSLEFILQTEVMSYTRYQAELVTFYEGGQFMLMINEVFEDVRLVAIPPETLAQFGREADNWMWPRHSADFALLRVYSSPDGHPAPYHPDNIPYRPKTKLTISPDGYQEDDFTLIPGYPGNTQRFIPSFGISEIEGIINPTVQEIRKIRSSILENAMQESEEILFRYTSKFSDLSNTLVYATGQNHSITKTGIIELRQKKETLFNEWIDTEPERIEKYSDVLPTLSLLYSLRTSLVRISMITMETVIAGNDLFFFALEGYKLKSELETFETLDPVTVEEFRELTPEHFRFYDKDTDMRLFTVLLEHYRTSLADSLRAPDDQLFAQKRNFNSSNLAKKIYANSIFVDQEKLLAFLDNPNLEVIQKDPAIQFIETIMSYYGHVYYLLEQIDYQLEQTMQQYIQGLMEMGCVDDFYPDANNTLRITYGNVTSFSPKDAVVYAHNTSIKGILEKHRQNPSVYAITEQWKIILANHLAYNDNINVCFITNNDITGGNSGSPVLNKYGQLIGLAFDGNYEGLASDLAYSENLQVSINLDIRFILFILNHSAPHLTNEILR